ncbi:MAG: hypothetical protein Q9198_010708, partial [Flavoplaca austrocitrina]
AHINLKYIHIIYHIYPYLMPATPHRSTPPLSYCPPIIPSPSTCKPIDPSKSTHHPAYFTPLAFLGTDVT